MPLHCTRPLAATPPVSTAAGRSSDELGVSWLMVWALEGDVGSVLFGATAEFATWRLRSASPVHPTVKESIVSKEHVGAIWSCECRSWAGRQVALIAMLCAHMSLWVATSGGRFVLGSFLTLI